MADFVTGVVIGKAVKWLWGKLPFKGKGGDADAAGSGLKPDADDVAESALKGGSGTGEGGLDASIKNIDEFIGGNKSFDDVLDDYAKVYADKINSNQAWSWDDTIPVQR